MPITVNQKRVQEALEKARQNVVRTNGGWLYLEAEGRCLRYLDDPRAADVFLQAAQNYPRAHDHEDEYVLVANLYRLAGDTTTAQQLYQRTYDLVSPKLEKMTPHYDRLALAGYMLGDDATVLDAVGQLRRAHRGSWLSVLPLPAIIEARQQHDPIVAQQAVTDIEAAIRKGRHQPWSTGSFTAWDVYDIAQQVLADLGGAPLQE